jgi:hypothetical protein
MDGLSLVGNGVSGRQVSMRGRSSGIFAKGERIPVVKCHFF